MNLTVDGNAVVTMPTREDVSRLESKVDRVILLLEGFAKAKSPPKFGG